MNAGIEPGSNALVQRAKAIILAPKDEWPKIAAETAPSSEIFSRYVVPLAAIGPIAGLIGGQVFGYGAFGFSYRPGLMFSIGTAAFSFILTLVGLIALTFIADFLAPKFGGQSNRDNAFKLVAYGSTASFVVGIFGLIPSLGFFSLLGLYSLYLYYTGAQPLMKVPADKALSYTAITIVAAVILSLIVMPIATMLTGMLGLGGITAASDAGGTVKLPGGGTLDTGKMEDFSKRMEDAANGKVKPVDTGKLQALLPAAIGSYQRTATESAAMGQVGSTAEATYEADDKRFTLKLVDMSAMGALAGMGAAMGVQQSREDADGYERTTTVDGQLRTEAWNTASGSGKYSVIVGNRFMVEADGNAASIEDLKAAVAVVDQDALVDLAD